MEPETKMRGVFGFGCTVDLDEFLEEHSMSSFGDVLDALEGTALSAFVSKGKDKLFLIDSQFCHVIPIAIDECPLPTEWVGATPNTLSDFLDLTEVVPQFRFFAAHRTLESAIDSIFEKDDEIDNIVDIDGIMDLLPVLENQNNSDSEEEDSDEDEDIHREPMVFGPISINDFETGVTQSPEGIAH